MSKLIRMALVGMLVPGAATGAVAMEDKQLSRTVGSGQEQRIMTHYRFNKSCVETVPSIIVTSPPRNGTVRHEPVDVTITDKMTKTASCVGKTIKGVNVFYKSVDGFTGTDSFVYERITSDRYDTAYTVSVEVQ